MERLHIKRIAGAALAIGIGAGALTGCAEINYSGDGNEFVVHGKVTDPGKQSLKVEVTRIDSANGEAEDWFKVGNSHQIHDNCICDDSGFFTDELDVGTTYSRSGAEIEPSEVTIGSCVQLIGAIRASTQGKSYDMRPVYETARVESC